jgi:uncharacterized protein (DUF2267 family)
MLLNLRRQLAKAASVSPDTVIFKVGAKAVTAGEFERILATFPEEIQQSARSNPKRSCSPTS